MNSVVINTFVVRGTSLDKAFVANTIKEILATITIKELFENYTLKNRFASHVTFDIVIETVWALFNEIDYQTPINVSDYGVELHIVRHGEDDKNKLGGWSGNHLTDKGREQISDLISFLDKDYEALVSSDLERAKETAAIISEKLGKPFFYDEAFRETNNGDLKDLNIEESEAKYPGLSYSTLKMDECYPNGESPSMFFERVSNAFKQLLEENRNKKVLLVTHAGVITVILCLVNGLRYSNLLDIAPPTGSLIKLK